MKKKVTFLIFIVLVAYFICVGAICANGQTRVTTDKAVNYTAVTNTNNAKGSRAVLAGKTFTDSKGVKYPVWKSVNGKLFYRKTSKNGNIYNVYIQVKN
jgi:hypothetical protein